MTARKPVRNSELAKIHIAKQQLGLDDETYRQMLWTIARVNSSKDLDYAGRRAVLEHLKARGFTGRKQFPGKPNNTSSHPQLKKIEALLADAKRPWSYADGMARNMFKVERVAWCKPDQLQRIIAALTYDQQRRAKKEAQQ
ncbi:MAG TPA: regulatory protein GemA [Steroidobacteraceae bacterium]|nr:regulatory protein GemA [Steroidobacteraceae bacterium]